MIPAGRTPLGTDDIAKRKGVKSLPRSAAEQLPAPISRMGARTRIWDREQIDAHLAGQEVPELPTEQSPEDLLDREEARLELHNPIKPEAWRSYVNHGHAPAPDQVVAGVPHWYRRTIRDWDANRPGAGAGGGRPKGSKDTKPRDRSNDPRLAVLEARLERVAKMVQDTDGKVTAAQVAAAEGISERHALRLLKDAGYGVSN